MTFSPWQSHSTKVIKSGIPPRDVLNLFGRRWNVEFLGPPLRKDP
jgi:hypothetical protein